MRDGELCMQINGSFSWGFTSSQKKEGDKKDAKKGADKKVKAEKPAEEEEK